VSKDASSNGSAAASATTNRTFSAPCRFRAGWSRRSRLPVPPFSDKTSEVSLQLADGRSATGRHIEDTATFDLAVDLLEHAHSSTRLVLGMLAGGMRHICAIPDFDGVGSWSLRLRAMCAPASPSARTGDRVRLGPSTGPRMQPGVSRGRQPVPDCRAGPGVSLSLFRRRGCAPP